MKLIELLNVETGASIETIERIISTGPRRYKVYDIPKRNGGTRTIAHPAKELKVLQRIILSSILNNIPINKIASAYVQGRGILYNAEIHLSHDWILKLDFKNFFHSIEPRDWDRVCNRTPELSKWRKDRQKFHNILFWGAGSKSPVCLSIGAPTSPMISNLVCSKLDEWLCSNANKLGLHVSRYADDITVSGNSRKSLESFENRLIVALKKNKGLQLHLNEEKRGIYGPGEKKMVTGLILTPDGKISIGRSRKREIHSLVCSFKHGDASDQQIMRAKGLLGFSKMAEADFFAKIIAKYGNDTVRNLLRYDLPDDYDF